MSLCNTCYDSGAYIDLCAESLIFGVVTPTTDYTVFIQSISTGKMQSFDVTSDLDGYISFTPNLSSNTSYEVWITQGTANSPKQNIAIDTLTYTCLEFSVVSTGDIPEEVYLVPEP